MLLVYLPHVGFFDFHFMINTLNNYFIVLLIKSYDFINRLLDHFTLMLKTFLLYIRPFTLPKVNLCYFFWDELLYDFIIIKSYVIFFGTNYMILLYLL